MAANILQRIFDRLRNAGRRDLGTHVLSAPAAGAGPEPAGGNRSVVPEQDDGESQPRRRVAFEHLHGDGDVPISVRILSAVLLHRSGYRQDAWDAFDALLRDPQLGGTGAGRARLLGEIFGRMQACMEQEGRFDAALAPAIVAYAVRAQACAFDGQRAPLEALRSPAEFNRQIAPLARRAELEHLLPAVRALTDAHLGSLPTLDVEALRVRLEKFVRVRPTLMAAEPASDSRPA